MVRFVVWLALVIVFYLGHLYAVHASGPGELVGGSHRRLSLYIVGARALADRGLLHHNGKQWLVTEAGEHVVALLQISGVYQELLAEFRAHDARFSLPTRRSA